MLGKSICDGELPVPKSIVLHIEGTIATVVLNRPERNNTLDKRMWKELGEQIQDCSANDALRCVVLRGATAKAFSPGADIHEFASERANAKQAREYGHLMRATLCAIRDCRHPT